MKVIHIIFILLLFMLFMLIVHKTEIRKCNEYYIEKLCNESIFPSLYCKTQKFINFTPIRHYEGVNTDEK